MAGDTVVSRQKSEPTGPGTPAKATVKSAPPPEPEWPPHFPEGCPGTRSDAKGEVYRFVKNDPPKASDVESHVEKQLGTGCEAAALSCNVSLDAVRAVRANIPRRKKQKVAKASLTPRHGKLEQTGDDPGHYDLWLRYSFWKSAHELFTVVAI